ncbi:4-phosphoerythronate dehydrogenase PdxB [Halomonas halocynthiae]|uniref:4-phosphoerythronate dehydrogenase PdxB n=1 Tax=Halomonas halocynthiae TaxID=176290 RepID=UPI000403FB47|nr:4-phosphoerythronate dehydrogenase PdxB [Halomonas halocynthiae]
MRIVVDANVPAADDTFGTLGEVVRVPGRDITAGTVRDADALVVRSVTPVTATLVEQSRLRFVGTCTIGTDHVDQAALEASGITFASVPGCNAEAVVDQVLISLLTLAERYGWQLSERRVGVVGAGNVGSRLLHRLQAMGVACLACDPPRAEHEASVGFHSLDELINQCDVLCLHTPLTHDGPHATYHLLGAQQIESLAPQTVLLNAGRGGCVDNNALRQRLERQGDLQVALDVWEQEPAINAALSTLVELATPHVAGYSLDGKLRGTHGIYRALCRTVGLPARVLPGALMPPPALAEMALATAMDSEDALRLCMRAVYDVRRDHDALSLAASTQGMSKGFDSCRANYPLRREFSTLTIRLSGGAQSLGAPLTAAGFRLADG